MNNALSGLLGSKKAVVYVTAIVAIAAIIFGGVDAQLAPAYIEKLSDLTMAYLGAQGLADAGKAFASKKAPAPVAAAEDDNSGQESRASATEDDDEEEAVVGPPPKTGA